MESPSCIPLLNLPLRHPRSRYELTRLWLLDELSAVQGDGVSPKQVRCLQGACAELLVQGNGIRRGERDQRRDRALLSQVQKCIECAHQCGGRGREVSRGLARRVIHRGRIVG